MKATWYPHLQGLICPRIHFEPWRWGLCFASKCQDPIVHWCSTITQNSRTLRYSTTEVSKLVHTEHAEGYSSLNPVTASDQPVSFRTFIANHLKLLGLLVTEHSVFRHPW